MHTFVSCYGNVDNIKKWLITNHISTDNYFAITHCTTYKYRRALNYLFKNYAIPDNIYYDAFYICSISGNLSIIKLLINYVKYTYRMDKILYMSIKYGYVSIVELLLQYKTNIYKGDDLFICSAANGHLEIMNLLLKYIFSEDTYNIALLRSVESGHLHIIRELIKTNKQLDFSKALESSVAHNNLEISQELIQAGAIINGYNTLFWSFSLDNPKIFQLILNSYKNISMSYMEIDSIIYNHSSSIIKLLVDFNIINADTFKFLTEIRGIFIVLKYYKYVNNNISEQSKFVREKRYNHYSYIINILIDLPYELYEEIAQFI